MKLLTKDVNNDLLSVSFNKRCFFQVNFLINAAFENAAFIREWCLFYISLPKYGVYWRAVFKIGNSVKYFTTVRSAGIILWWWWFEGGHMKFSKTERGDQQFFCCFQEGIKNLTESFIPFLPPPPPPPPPRELKNDNSVIGFNCLQNSEITAVYGN